jgi:CYTH domain-containing protein
VTVREGVEIERKFLVGEAPEGFERCEASDIRQGYLAVADEGAEVRVRERDGDATLTVKRGEGMVHDEEEIEIGADEFRRLWRLTDGRRVEKRRHLVPHGDLTIEVDVYAGDLDGLVIAEVEFPSEDAAEEFEPPDWLGRELTGDPRFRTQRLAVDGKPAA